MEEIDKTLFKEEFKGEKRANYVRGVLGLIFLIMALATYKNSMAFDPALAYANFTGAIVFLVYFLVLFFLFRKSIYKPFIKYISVIIEPLILTGVLWGNTYGPNGWYTPFMTSGLVFVYFMFNALAGLRYSFAASLTSGIATTGCFTFMFLYAIFFAGENAVNVSDFVSVFEFTDKSKIGLSAINQIIKIVFLFSTSLVISLMAYNSKKLIKRSVASEISTRKRRQELELIFQNVRKISQRLSETSSKLVQESEENKTIVNKMFASLGEISSSSHSQQNSVEQTSASVEEMTSAINNISENASMLSNTAEGLSGTISDLVISLKKISSSAGKADETAISLAEMAKKGTSTMKSLVKSIRDVGQFSGKVSEIVTVIDDISARTNILGLNAAIEASKAGEAGSGFAVVASQIRSLAENSSKSSKQIVELIADIVKNINESISLSEEAGKLLEDMFANVAKTKDLNLEISKSTSKQSSSIQKIASEFGNLKMISEQIDNSLSEQRKGNDNILSVISNLKEKSDVIHSETEQQSEIGNHIKQTINTLDEIVEENTSITEELVDITNKNLENDNVSDTSIVPKDE